MTRIALQLLQVTTFAAIAVATHSYVSGRRQTFLTDLEGLAGTSMSSFAAVFDAVAALIYVAFAAVTVPFGGGTTGPQDLESVFDAVAVFALLVAAAQVVGFVVLHRVAHHLEPWPPKDASFAGHA